MIRPFFKGRVLSPEGLEALRREFESFDTIEKIDDDVRAHH
jgi:hypothetical protein